MSGNETLAELMSRMEARRKHYQRQHDHFRLIAIGFLLVALGIVLTFRLSPFALVVPFLFSPYILAAYRVPEFRFNEEFLRETIRFYLNERGTWTHESHAANFPAKAFYQTGLTETPRFAVGHVIRGEAWGMPMMMADISIMGLQRVKFIRPPVLFTGFVVMARPFGLPPVTEVSNLSSSWRQKLAKLDKAKVAVRDGAIWLMKPAESFRYGKVSLDTPLNEPAPYEKVKSALDEMFNLIAQLG